MSLGDFRYRDPVDDVPFSPMTLIVAVRAADGVVLASDSRTTDGASGVTVPSQKVFRVPGQPILFGGAGPGPVIEAALENMKSCPPLTSLKKGKVEAGRRLLDVIETYRADLLRVGEEVPEGTRSTAVLLAGLFGSELAIIEVVPGQVMTDHSAIATGGPILIAIGSSRTAQMLAGRYKDPTLKLPLGAAELLAYYTVAECIERMAGFFGGPVQLASVTANGDVEVASPGKLSRLDQEMKEWQRDMADLWVDRFRSPERPAQQIDKA